MMSVKQDPLTPHAHDPNPQPPSADPSILFFLRPGHSPQTITVADLKAMPQTEINDCYIISTGHGTSGPFDFRGVTLRDLLSSRLPAGYTFSQVKVVSGDGFGTRIQAAEVIEPVKRPILLATGRNGLPLTREQGLVRLIVPTEQNDALRQVKWITTITIIP